MNHDTQRSHQRSIQPTIQPSIQQVQSGLGEFSAILRSHQLTINPLVSNAGNAEFIQV
ncbi:MULTISPECIES: hypothetical protein [Moorena]|uniref:hypothetical protein n=1 Tax=Moorena TaxID=1155738 RepID=UPI0003153816|nr:MULTISPECIES: hypothetical protein [Moorena]NEQ14418.1 hypothetical protein [Moorena sp. SIO3E2]NEP67561.1 hypothetical protein [Moorena sp. SIO3A5]NEQ11204.1 hypothetical protein [Moorena sp. SIO4E2]NER91729.1 hypothetical protein [Moorena sp. SIO3A2]NES44495.1 hypothetical protein [Moorena sp. SIO2C4]